MSCHAFKYIYEQFNSKSHSGFLVNVLNTVIDKADPSDLKKRGNYWIQTLKTIATRSLIVIGNSGWLNLNCDKCSVIGFSYLALDHPVWAAIKFGQYFWICYIYSIRLSCIFNMHLSDFF